MTIGAILPRYHDHWAGLAWAAHAIWQDRVRRYPDLVRRQKLSNVQARRDLDVAEAIAREWRTIAHLEPAPAAPADIFAPEKARSLTLARNRFAVLLGTKRSEPGLGLRLELTDVLIWHYQTQTQSRYGPLTARLIADRENTDPAARRERAEQIDEARNLGATFIDPRPAERKAA